MTKHLSSFLLSAAFAILFSTSSFAQQVVIINAEDPDVLQSLMQNEGYVVKQDLDKDGDPRFEGRLSRSTSFVNFYGCSEGKNCTHIVFTAAWNLDAGMSVEKINEWNRQKIWGKAHLDDENDPYLELVVNMKGGITSVNFLDTVDWWRIAIESFEKHIGW